MVSHTEEYSGTCTIPWQYGIPCERGVKCKIILFASESRGTRSLSTSQTRSSAFFGSTWNLTAVVTRSHSLMDFSFVLALVLRISFLVCLSMIPLLHNVWANHIGSVVASANSAEYDSSKETGSCNCSPVQHTRKHDGVVFHRYKVHSEVCKTNHHQGNRRRGSLLNFFTVSCSLVSRFFCVGGEKSLVYTVCACAKYSHTDVTCVTQNTNWGEPERAPHWSNGVPRDLYMYMSRTSFRKYLMPPRLESKLSNSLELDSFDFVMRHQARPTFF